MRTEQRYRKLLGSHDWYYNYSDDYSVWAKGKASYAEIWDLQPNIDPDFKIWNEYAPQDFKRQEK